MIPARITEAHLKSRTARAKLDARKKPYFISIAPGVQLGYRRAAGSWTVRITANGADWLKRIALADDHDDPSPPAILDYYGARKAAMRLATGGSPDDEEVDDRPPRTVGEAINAYVADLKARGADPYNGSRVRYHLSAALLATPITVLTGADLIGWRNGLIAKGLRPANLNRMRTCLRAALTLAAKRDRRIGNAAVWQTDFVLIPNATRARNHVLPDDETVHRFVEAAYARDGALGLLVEAMAETGARPSQLVRLTVGDLDLSASGCPTLAVPRSGKGHTADRARKMAQRKRVPISTGLGERLRAARDGRPADAPLLRRSNGQPWGFRRQDQYGRTIAAIVAELGLDPRTTLYALRHTAITRQVSRGMPTTIVAALADTSIAMIEDHYCAGIDQTLEAQALARRALPSAARPRLATVDGRSN